MSSGSRREERRGGEDRADVDGAFRRLLDAEGIPLGPDAAPVELGASERSRPASDDGDDDGDAPHRDGGDDAARRRARRMHPSAGLPRRPRRTERDVDGSDPLDREALDADDPFLEDFRAPDPELPPVRGRSATPWALLIVGLVLVLLAVFIDLPRPLGALGGAGVVGGLIWLLARTPREPRAPGDGAQV